MVVGDFLKNSLKELFRMTSNSARLMAEPGGAVTSTLNLDIPKQISEFRDAYLFCYI
jgi:hypothetical protein|tara:strand:+ start:1422 stop:1592 length:171 start_codon:yes stop_codon:yes gene_type:complete